MGSWDNEKRFVVKTEWDATQFAHDNVKRLLTGGRAASLGGKAEFQGQEGQPTQATYVFWSEDRTPAMAFRGELERLVPGCVIVGP